MKIMLRETAIIFVTCLLLMASFVVGYQSTSRTCYPDYCHNTTNFVSEASGDLCLIQPVSRGQECLDMKFESLGHTPAIGDYLAKVSLIAYVKDFGGTNGKATAFNLTVDDVNFHKLITRYQDLAYPEFSACRRVEFYGNLTMSPFKEFYVSCPFSNNSYELYPYRLEYLISSNNYEYSRKFVFVVPRHRFIDNSVKNVTYFTPFIYVDVSDSTVLTLYIQVLPPKFKVTYYKVWMINIDTNSTFEIELEDFKKEPHIKYTFSVHDGVHYFKVAALHPSCGEYGCVNSTSPLISIKQLSNRLLIMIISVVWIPPVILFTVWHFYKIYKRKEMLKRFERKPKCLLIYSPTHMSHVNVMIDLARYLRSCNIFAMIDTLDISESENKDPLIWCSDAFHSAEVVVVATSPPTNDIAPVIYRNMDAQALRLLRENYPLDSKRYYALQFPYCRKKDIPKEAKHFKKFIMPEELNKLVKAIHQTDYFPAFFDTCSKDFLESVKLAVMQVVPQDKKIKTSKAQEELLLPELETEDNNGEVFPLKEIKPKSAENLNGIGNGKSQKFFKTNIEELNLLGETHETDNIEYNPSTSTSQFGFRIDSLKL